jgi:hypothetical protein
MHLSLRYNTLEVIKRVLTGVLRLVRVLTVVLRVILRMRSGVILRKSYV